MSKQKISLWSPPPLPRLGGHEKMEKRKIDMRNMMKVNKLKSNTTTLFSSSLYNPPPFLLIFLTPIPPPHTINHGCILQKIQRGCCFLIFEPPPLPHHCLLLVPRRSTASTNIIVLELVPESGNYTSLVLILFNCQRGAHTPPTNPILFPQACVYSDLLWMVMEGGYW